MAPKVLVDTIHLLSPKTGVGKYTYENCIRLRNLELSRIQWF